LRPFAADPAAARDLISRRIYTRLAETLALLGVLLQAIQLLSSASEATATEHYRQLYRSSSVTLHKMCPPIAQILPCLFMVACCGRRPLYFAPVLFFLFYFFSSKHFLRRPSTYVLDTFPHCVISVAVKLRLFYSAIKLVGKCDREGYR